MGTRLINCTAPFWCHINQEILTTLRAHFPARHGTDSDGLGDDAETIPLGCRHADGGRLHTGESLCGTLIFRRAVVCVSKHNSVLNVQRLIVVNVNDTDSPSGILAAHQFF